MREGVGIATSNVAEYRALILGMKVALKEGFKHIRANGDSKLVCMQVESFIVFYYFDQVFPVFMIFYSFLFKSLFLQFPHVTGSGMVEN